MSLRHFAISNRGLKLAANEYPVLIIDGQSNAVGDTNESAGSYAGQQSGVYVWSNAPATDPDVFQFKVYEAGVTSRPRDFTNGYGYSVEVVTGKELQARFGKDVYIIRSGAGGQPISMWASGQTLLTQLVNRTTAAIAAIDALGRTPVFVGFAWLQGEAEVVAGNSASGYVTALQNLIANARAIDSRMQYMPFYCFELSSTQTGVNPPAGTPTKAQISQAMRDAVAATKRAYSINTDALLSIGTIDNIHYNSAALQSMGMELYKRIIE
jgi:hypothetical protein